MKRLGLVSGSLVLGAALAAPRAVAAAEPTYVSGAAGGSYPQGAVFSGIDVTGLELALGSDISPDGTGSGQLTAVLLGLTVAGETRPITVEGKVTGGTRNAANVAVLSGVATLDLGDGLPPAPDVPFTATLVRDAATALGTVSLVIGSAELPGVTLGEGSLTIQTVPAEPLEEEPPPVTVAGAP
jgi:hypothetical protein